MRRLEQILLLLLIGSIPIQLGYHFWPHFAYVSGIRIDYLSPIIYFNDLFLVMIAFLHLSGSIIRKAFLKTVLLPLGVTLLICTPSLFLVQETGSFFYQYMRLVLYIFFGMSIAKNSSRLFLSKTTHIYLYVALAVVLLELAQFMSQSSIQGIFYWLGERNFSLSSPGIARFMMDDNLILRPYATFPHPNVLGFYLFVALLFSRYMILKSHTSFKKIISLIIYAVFFLGLTLTFSRVLIILATILLFLDLVKLKRAGVLLAGTLVIIGFFILGDRFSASLLIEDSIQRYDHVLKLGRFLTYNLFWGVGLGQYFYYQIQVEREISPYFLQPPHNTLFLVLIQAGVLGVLFSFWGLWQTAKKLLTAKHSYENELVLILFITIVFASLFDHYFVTLHQGMLLTALIFGLAWSRDA